MALGRPPRRDAGDDAKHRDSGRRTVGPLLGGVSVRPARWWVTSKAKGRLIWRGLMPNGDQIMRDLVEPATRL